MGQQLIIHTDHKNLVYKSHTSDRVMRWRLYIEEYSPEIQYIKGEHNVVADALSRLDKASEDEHIPDDKESFYATCYGADSAQDRMDLCPLSYKQINFAQKDDSTLMKMLADDKNKFELQVFHGGGKSWSLICNNGKIVIPEKLQFHIIDWYHTMLCHPGINRTEETIGQNLW